MASEGFFLSDTGSNQYLENYIQIKKKITTQDNRSKKKSVNTVKLLLFRSSPIMLPMNICVTHPKFPLHEVQFNKMASCNQYICFTYKNKLLLKKTSSPPQICSTD